MSAADDEMSHGASAGGGRRRRRPRAPTIAGVAPAGAAPRSGREEKETPETKQQRTSSPRESSSASATRGARRRRPASRPRPRKSRTTSASHVSPFALLASGFVSAPALAAPANNLQRQQQHDRERRRESSSGCVGKWHISIDRALSCTNSPVFPPEWVHPSVRDYIFHDEPYDCCRDVVAIFGACEVIDACGASGSHYDVGREMIGAAACDKNAWHMSTEVLYACTNDDVYPDAWNEPPMARRYFFDSPAECCEKSYPYQRCDVIDTCPTPSPTPPPTSKPTNPPRTRKPRPNRKPRPTEKIKPGRKPTPKPTPHPTAIPRKFEWYVDRATSKCVMDCVDEPRRPCGGRKSAWEQGYPDATACCESISWVPARDCMATASPARDATNPPTASLAISSTPIPIAHAPLMNPTPKPRKRPRRTDRPTANPTPRPTADCPAPHWYLFRNGRQSTCSNDVAHSGGILNLTFESAEQCCNAPLAGDDCRVLDVCEPGWFADFSRGWDEGICVSAEHAPVPRGRQTFDSMLQCCLDQFLGQSSEACLSSLEWEASDRKG